MILTLAVSLGTALVFGYVTQRLGLSPIVGYLLAGVAIGPNTPGVLADPALAEQLAEVGVILLMFGVGLQFHLEELLAVRRVAVPGAVAGIAAATLLGAACGAALRLDAGRRRSSSGSRLSVASTVVLVRVLSDTRQLHTSAGHIAVGWLVVEDLLTVIVLVLLPTLVGGARPRRGHRGDVALTLLKVAAARRRSPASSARARFRSCSIAWPPRARASCSR